MLFEWIRELYVPILSCSKDFEHLNCICISHPKTKYIVDGKGARDWLGRGKLMQEIEAIGKLCEPTDTLYESAFDDKEF